MKTRYAHKLTFMCQQFNVYKLLVDTYLVCVLAYVSMFVVNACALHHTTAETVTLRWSAMPSAGFLRVAMQAMNMHCIVALSIWTRYWIWVLINSLKMAVVYKTVHNAYTLTAVSGILIPSWWRLINPFTFQGGFITVSHYLKEWIW